MATIIVQPQQAALDGGLRRLFDCQPSRASPVQDGRHAVSLEIACPLRGAGRRPPDYVGIEPVPLPQSDQDHTAGRDRAARIEHGHLPSFATEIAALDQITDSAAQRLVNGLRRAARLGPLKEIDSDGVGVALLNRARDGFYVHWWVSPSRARCTFTLAMPT